MLQDLCVIHLQETHMYIISTFEKFEKSMKNIIPDFLNLSGKNRKSVIEWQ